MFSTRTWQQCYWSNMQLRAIFLLRRANKTSNSFNLLFTIMFLLCNKWSWSPPHRLSPFCLWLLLTYRIILGKHFLLGNLLYTAVLDFDFIHLDLFVFGLSSHTMCQCHIACFIISDDKWDHMSWHFHKFVEHMCVINISRSYLAVFCANFFSFNTSCILSWRRVVNQVKKIIKKRKNEAHVSWQTREKALVEMMMKKQLNVPTPIITYERFLCVVSLFVKLKVSGIIFVGSLKFYIIAPQPSPPQDINETLLQTVQLKWVQAPFVDRVWEWF